ncbi:uncharacterized protein LOC127093515 [Lathyrus oleraceus]|uniref:uncharacterized protein LOC127093515 n=1 Tax=Pisum sativum TaxID=3888 RepID=UPI0021D244DB|nr:uncharacterized protein LOC127093515 [Pisum sativum]
MCPRCGAVYNRELDEAFERIPSNQGWNGHGGNQNMYIFDKRGVSRRQDSPHPRVKKVMFKLPAEVPEDKWTQEGSRRENGEVLRMEEEPLGPIENSSGHLRERLSDWRTTKERIPCQGPSGEDVRVLPYEYNQETKIEDNEETDVVEMAKHKPVCYYVLNNGAIEEQNALFERPHQGMQNHLKPLYIRAKAEHVGYYIKPIDLYVSSYFDVIKYMLSKPIMHSRIGKWALALTEYSLAFMPLRAMKGQIVSDFIVDHAVVESPQLQVELKPWRLFFDGSTHKDGSGVGIMIISLDGIPTKLKYRIEDIKHVPRIKNQEANDLAQIASRYRTSQEKLEELVKVRGKVMAARFSPTDLESTQLGYANKEEFEVLAIDTLMDTDWRNPIISYLKDPSIDTERKTKYMALSYVLMGNELFKKTPEGILLKCLGENEAYLALSSVHNGACGAHQAGIQHAPASEVHAIIKPWPFRGWALYLIGEIQPTSSKGQRYILVGVDYFTKWVETVPLVNVDQEIVIEFIQRQILYRFGIPKSITTDQGSVFTGRKMQEFAKEMGFKLLTSTPYYAQANGQVEAANKVIIGLIKKHVGKKPKNWHKTLDQALWASRTSPKEATNTTPFQLTFGHDAVLLVEIYLQSVRIQRQGEIPSDLYWEMMMNELVDLDEERLHALEVLRRQKERVARAYNNRVKGKTFIMNDLVWKVILPMDRKNKTLGKWSPHWEGPFRILKAFSNNAYEIEEQAGD